MVNYYSVLKVSTTATEEEIRGAINRELRVWSNRTNAPQIERRQEAERMVKVLEESEATLLNREKRAKYDRDLITAPTEERTVGDAEVQGSQDLVAQGWQLLIQGNIPDALFVATKATERDGANPEAWALLGQAKYRWGDQDDAIYEYKRAIKLKPNQASYYFDLGTIYESGEKVQEALQQYDRAAQIDPKTTMYRAAVGILAIKQGNLAKGTDILERCVSQEPDNPTYQWFLAIAYADRAYENWTLVPEGHEVSAGYYATEKAHVEAAKEYLTKAERLKCDDAELSAHIQEVRKNIESMESRQFHGNKVAAWAAIAFGALYGLSACPASFSASGAANVLGALLAGVLGTAWFLGGGIFYLYACKVPQYVLNRRIISGKGVVGSAVAMAKAQQLGEAVGGEYGPMVGCLGSLFVFFYTVPLIPIMALYNYYQNYMRTA